MSWLDRAERIKALRDSLGLEWPSCVNCYHFAKTEEVCGLDPLRRRPPAEVIAKGCPSFEEDVPF